MHQVEEPAGSPVARASAVMISTPLSPRLAANRLPWRRAPGRLQADDPARWCDSPGQQVQDPARPAAEVDRSLSGPQAHPVQQCRAVGGQFLGLALQPGALPGLLSSA